MASIDWFVQGPLRRLVEAIAEAFYYVLSLNPLYTGGFIVLVVLVWMFLRRAPSR